MKRLIMDLDNTITASGGPDYANARPNAAVIARLHAYRREGFEIAIATSRNMRTHANNVGKINAMTLPVILDWLGRHDVPYDEVWTGKPWCGHHGFYVDDRAVRPDEFAKMDYATIAALLGISVDA